jgi:hypothetical protein
MRITCTIRNFMTASNIQATMSIDAIGLPTYNLRTRSNHLRRTIIQQVTYFVPTYNAVMTVRACVYVTKVRQETLQQYSEHLPSCHQYCCLHTQRQWAILLPEDSKHPKHTLGQSCSQQMCCQTQNTLQNVLPLAQ